MRNILLSATIFALTSTTATPQERFISADYSNFFDWFHKRSQTPQLYTDNATLYIFGEHVDVFSAPSRRSNVLTEVDFAQPVRNIAPADLNFPEDEINGYADIWYKVSGKDHCGNAFKGYVWGAHIAKSWQKVDLDRDGKPEFVMLGISSNPRLKPRDIQAEIRIAKGKSLLYRTTIPELCVFEECATSSLIRVLNDQPLGGKIMIETSTMTVGCWAGIEKAFFYWDGRQLERVFHAEYTTQKEYLRKSFVVTPDNQEGTTAMVCYYSREDAHYNPVWDCKAVKAAPKSDDKQVIASREVVRAR